jgi:hypothetical protein
MTFVFDAALFDAVASIVQPKRRRRLSPEHRAKLAETGAAFRFQHGFGARGAPLEPLKI